MSNVSHFPQSQQSNDLAEFGSEEYVYAPKQRERLKTTFTRTIRPANETNSAFEMRMDAMARALVEQHSCKQVLIKMLRADGAIVECIVTVIYDEPRSAPIFMDLRQAGGRVPGRGQRGSGKAAA